MSLGTLYSKVGLSYAPGVPAEWTLPNSSKNTNCSSDLNSKSPETPVVGSYGPQFVIKRLYKKGGSSLAGDPPLP